jgi:glycosyltransferase involved in cell wall biosynthesis
MTPPRVACFATQGSGSNDEARLTYLLGELGAELLPFARGRKLRSMAGLVRRLARTRPDVVVMEGTGFAGGLALIVARALFGVRYVVSSGDAVTPFVGSVVPALRPVAALYERALCRSSAGFIGWTPYLVGRALTLGAPCGVTAAGWSPTASADGDARRAVRERYGIPADALVFGIVGSLAWNRHAGYCYGLELVRAMRRVKRPDVRVLVVGDGSGRARLEEEAGDDLGQRIVVPGPVPREDVPAVLAAIDVASLPQTVDGVGSFRYTTKLSEYLAARRPVVTSRIPVAYDLDGGWLWRLPGTKPWEDPYVQALAELMERVSAGEIADRCEQIPARGEPFDGEAQRRRVTAFIRDVASQARPAR